VSVAWLAGRTLHIDLDKVLPFSDGCSGLWFLERAVAAIPAWF
jgi:hypothetical protein